MNHPSMPAKVEQCQKILGYQFKDRNLCWEALQMAGNGVTVAGPRSIPNGNKRLAIIGDYVIDLILSEAWYGRGELEGIWDFIRKSTASNVRLGNVGMTSNLVTCVVLPNGQRQASPKMMAITVEALIGAVYLDAGIAAAGNVMQKLGITHVETAV